MIEVHRSILAGSIGRLVLVIMLVCSVLAAANTALAKKGKAPQVEQLATVEFSRLIERWQKTENPEEQITALEAALKLEPTLKTWPNRVLHLHSRG